MAKPRRHIHLHCEGDIAVGVSITPDAAAKPTPSGGLAFGIDVDVAGCMDTADSATPADPGSRSQSPPLSNDGLSDPPSPP